MVLQMSNNKVNIIITHRQSMAEVPQNQAEIDSLAVSASIKEEKAEEKAQIKIQQNQFIQQSKNDNKEKSIQESPGNLQTIVDRINQRLISQPVKEFIQLPTTIQFKSPVYFKPHPINISSGIKQSPPNSPSKPQQSRISISSSQWSAFVKQAYDFYCKSTYHLGKTPTFDQIQTKTSKMTVSAFVGFCRDFGIKLDLIVLMNIFKTATSFSSNMSQEQFLQALFIISQNIFKKEPNSNDQNQFLDSNAVESPQNLSRISKKMSKKRQPPSQFEKLLKMIKMDSPNAFRNKKTELDLKARKHGVNAHETLIKLKPTSQYKFEVSALNGKTPQDIREQIQLRKKIKEDNKQKTEKLRYLKQQIEAHRYEDLNKISISDKKITKGGYMSPPRRYKNGDSITMSSGDSKTMGNSLLESQIRPLKKIKTFEMNQTEVMKENQSKRKLYARHKTELNTYNNSLESSMYEDILQRQTILNGQQKSTKYNGKQSKLRRQTKGYLYKFRAKDNNSGSKDKNNYQLNKIIKRAKQELKEVDSQTPKRSILNSSNIYSHATNKILNPGLKTSPDQEEQYGDLEQMLGDLEDDEFLQKIEALKKKKGENQKKRKVIREFIKF